MIKDKGKAMEICARFGDFTDEQKKQLEKNHLTQYLFYSRLTGRKNDERSCFCTACETPFMENIYISEVEFIHKQFTKCPICGATVKAYQNWRGKDKLHERRNIMVLEARDEALLIRIFDIRHWFHGSVLFYTCDEDWKIYVAPGVVQKYQKDYYSKKHIPISNDNALKIDIDGVVGRAETDRTFLRYFDIWKYYDNQSGYMVPSYVWMKYIFTAAKHPNIEYLDKLGMKRLIVDLLDGNMKLIKWRSNNVKDMLGLSKNELHLCDWNAIRLRFHHEMVKRNTRDREIINVMVQGDASAFYDLYLENVTKIAKRLPSASLLKIQKYAHGDYNRTRDWRDYLADLGDSEIGADFTDTSLTFPKDLQAAKDRIREMIRIKADESTNKKIRQRIAELKRYVYSDDMFMIVIPECVQEFVDEGNALSHCVGTYAHKHADGKTTVLFLREKAAPDVPFYTIEVDVSKQKIVQCRGYKNNIGTAKPEAVRNFEKRYEDFIRNNRSRQIKKQTKQEAKSA